MWQPDQFSMSGEIPVREARLLGLLHLLDLVRKGRVRSSGHPTSEAAASALALHPG